MDENAIRVGPGETEISWTQKQLLILRKLYARNETKSAIETCSRNIDSWCVKLTLNLNLAHYSTSSSEDSDEKSVQSDVGSLKAFLARNNVEPVDSLKAQLDDIRGLLVTSVSQLQSVALRVEAAVGQSTETVQKVQMLMGFILRRLDQVALVSLRSDAVQLVDKASNVVEISIKQLTWKPAAVAVGSSGSVHKGTWQLSDGVSVPVAYKILSQATISLLSKETVLLEAEVLWSLVGNPNIVRLYGRTDDPVGLVFEWCDGKDLHVKLHSPGALDMSLIDKLLCISQLIAGVNALHMRDIVHLDLKPANVLVVNTEEEKEWVTSYKIADFGASKLDAEQHISVLSTKVNAAVTLMWQAPELLKSSEVNDIVSRKKIRRSKAVDVFALGIIIAEILLWKLPYAQCNGNDGLVTQAKQDTFKAELVEPLYSTIFDFDGLMGTFGREAHGLVMHCLRKQPTERITVAELQRQWQRVMVHLLLGPSPSDTMAVTWRHEAAPAAVVQASAASPGSAAMPQRIDCVDSAPYRCRQSSRTAYLLATSTSTERAR